MVVPKVAWKAGSLAVQLVGLKAEKKADMKAVTMAVASAVASAERKVAQ
jgi:hypothetical protein